MDKIFYLCDGEREICKKRTCYKNGGNCRHTTDINHATNFERKGKYKNGSFYEKEDVSRNDIEKDLQNGDAVMDERLMKETEKKNEDSGESPSVDELVNEWLEEYEKHMTKPPQEQSDNSAE